MSHSIFNEHAHIGVCDFCEVHTRVIYMTPDDGDGEDVEGCGACYREGLIPPFYIARLGCMDCREYAAFFERQ